MSIANHACYELEMHGQCHIVWCWFPAEFNSYACNESVLFKRTKMKLFLEVHPVMCEFMHVATCHHANDGVHAWTSCANTIMH